MYSPRSHSILRLGLVASLALAFSAGAAAPTAEAATVKKVRGIAMVNMQRVLLETKAGIAARKKLEESSTAKQKKLDKKRKKLEADQAKLKDLSGEQLMAAQEALQRELLEMQNVYMTMQQELAQQEGQILEDMYKKSQEIVDKLAGEMELDLVLIRDENTVLYTDESLDITQLVISRYNEKHPS